MNATLVQKPGSRFGVDSEAFISVNNITDKNYCEGQPVPERNFLAGLTFRSEMPVIQISIVPKSGFSSG